MKTKSGYALSICVFWVYHINDVAAGGFSTTTTTRTTTTTIITTTDATSSTENVTTVSSSASTTVNTTQAASTVLLTNNSTPMIIGIAVGVGVVAAAVLATAITYAVLQHKKVHPSETETIFSDSTSESDYDSRPTTASHIFVDQAEDAPSRPVTMTPFELRKLFVETFPYERWKPGYDGSLKPRMPLRFVHPSRYSRTKSEEQDFRKKIYQFEMTESLTISRPPSSTRLHTRSRAFSTHTLDPVPERIYHNGDVLQTEGEDLFRSEQTDGHITEQTIENFTDVVSANDNLLTEDEMQNENKNKSSGSNSERADKSAKENIGLNSNQNTNVTNLEQGQNKAGYELEEYVDVEKYDDIMTTEL